MESILVAGYTEASVQSGLRLASDLSVASGARLSVVRVAQSALANQPVTEGNLTDPLFAPSDWRTPVPRFSDTAPRKGDLRAESGDLPDLIARIEREKPSLVIARDTKLARALVAETAVPVWHLHSSQAEREWFTMRRLRCATLGLRATVWAQSLAESLGAELEVAPGMLDADVTVLTRGVRSTLLTMVAARTAQPVVIV